MATRKPRTASTNPKESPPSDSKGDAWEQLADQLRARPPRPWNAFPPAERQELEWLNDTTADLVAAAVDEVKKANVARQRDVARQPRPDRLQRVILDFVKARPTISERDLRDALAAMAIPGTVIDQVTDQCVEWVNKRGELEETPLSALKDRLSRAKRSVNRALSDPS